jgi:hypothetical protein
VSQINFAYGFATKGPLQAHMHLLGAEGAIKQQLRSQMPHVDQWALTCDDRGYAEFFKARRRRVSRGLAPRSGVVGSA